MPRRDTVGALAVFTLVSFLYFGLPIAAHPGRYEVGSGTDPNLFVWMFAWWPHAISHGVNPFHSYAIWVPGGYDLAWTTSVPGLAVIFAPLTLAAGPVVAYNVASILMPALAAWTAYLLCRHVTEPSLAFARRWLSLRVLVLHARTAARAPAPHLDLPRPARRARDASLRRRVARPPRPRGRARSAARRAGLVCGRGPAHDGPRAPRGARTRLSRRSASAARVCAVRSGRSRPGACLRSCSRARCSSRCSPSSASVPPIEPWRYPTDFLDLVVPTRTALVSWGTAGISSHYYAGTAETGGYFGLPVLVIVALFLRRSWRAPPGRFLFLAALLPMVAALGTALYIDGRRIIALPWALASHVLILHSLLPGRLVVFATLAVSVMVASWAATSSHRGLAIVLTAAAVVSLLPRLGAGYWKNTPDQAGALRALQAMPRAGRKRPGRCPTTGAETRISGRRSPVSTSTLRRDTSPPPRRPPTTIPRRAPSGSTI